MKGVYKHGRQLKKAGKSGLRKKVASTPQENAGEFMRSPEPPDFNRREGWPAKIGCTAGEKGILHRDTVNETML